MTLIFSAVLTFYVRQKLKYRREVKSSTRLKAGKESEVTEPRSEATKSKSVIQRLAFSHLQVLSIVGKFDFVWPEAVRNMFGVSETVSSVGTSIGVGGGLKCLANSVSSLPLPFSMALFYCTSLIVGALGVVGFWQGIKKFRKKDTVKDHTTVSLIVLVFLMYSSIVSSFFKLFSCTSYKEDGDQLRLSGDLDVLCYGSYHVTLLIVIGAPVGLFFVIGLPLFAYIKLRSSVKNGTLHSMEVMPTYGFL